MPEFTKMTVGCFTIRRRERYSTRHREGLRPSWTEYQVWRGRKIISRHDFLLAAERDAQARLDAFWDEQARQLAAIRQAKTIDRLEPRHRKWRV